MFHYKRLLRTFDKMSEENTINNLELPVKASWMEGKKSKPLKTDMIERLDGLHNHVSDSVPETVKKIAKR